MLVTDFPESIYGNFEYFHPIPNNGEFFINNCARKSM